MSPLLLHRLSRNFPHALLLISAATPTIRTAFPQRLAALPKLCSDPRCRSNPIAHRARRKRQRLPPSLLIENASVQLFSLSSTVLPEAFPIKASDKPSGILVISFRKGVCREYSVAFGGSCDPRSQTRGPGHPCRDEFALLRPGPSAEAQIVSMYASSLSETSPPRSAGQEIPRYLSTFAGLK